MFVADVCGKIRGVYISVIVDVYSRFVSIKIIKKKSGAMQHVIEFIKWVETQTGNKLKHFHSDGGGEYHPKELTDYLNQQGTTTSSTSRDTPQHNGIAERVNQTILEMTRAMLRHASLPASHWEYAAHTSAYIINRCVPNIYKAKPSTTNTHTSIHRTQTIHQTHASVWMQCIHAHQTYTTHWQT